MEQINKIMLVNLSSLTTKNKNVEINNKNEINLK